MGARTSKAGEADKPSRDLIADDDGVSDDDEFATAPRHARASRLVYLNRFELIAQTSDFLRLLPPRCRKSHEDEGIVDEVIKTITQELNRDREEQDVATRVQRETDAKLKAMQDKVDAMQAKIDQILACVSRS